MRQASLHTEKTTSLERHMVSAYIHIFEISGFPSDLLLKEARRQIVVCGEDAPSGGNSTCKGPVMRENRCAQGLKAATVAAVATFTFSPKAP